jgi:hypothetical protein
MPRTSRRNRSTVSGWCRSTHTSGRAGAGDRKRITPPKVPSADQPSRS